MSPGWQVAFYAGAIVCFLAAAFGLPKTVRRPILIGWLGAALATCPSLFAAVQAL